jgi:hypothetical protein
MNPRLLRPTPTGFDPRRIAGLEMWFDAADLSAMAQNSDGTTAVVATDDPVGFWRDKSGKTRHAKQTTNNNRPALKLADKNGRPGLNFDGSDDFFLCDSGTAFAAAIAILVIRRTGNPASYAAVYNHSPVSNIAGISASPQTFAVQQASGVVGRLYGLQGSAGITRQNGTALTATNSGFFNLFTANLLPNTTDTNVISVQGNITTTVGPQFPLIGVDSFAATRVYPMRLYELLIYSVIPSTAQLQTIERYLGRKWGITVA